jgi:DNA-binding transcriptional ArsR family regulator
MVTYNKRMAAELVFKALAEPHRRYLLDALAQTDGQSLTDLCAHLPMSRFGVMKHLRVLEEAGLITTRKVGREKRHYLNPAPIQDVAAWVEQYRRFWDERLDRLEDYLRDLQAKEQSDDHRES